jgi:hypothetical protein
MGKFGYEGPLMDLGNALEESQGKRNGKLTLDVVRGEQKLKVELQLTTKYGSFSSTYPFDCKKTDLILQETYAYLIKGQKPDGTWHGRPHINAFAALALLGSAGCATVSETGRKQLILLSPQEEMQLGLTSFTQTKKDVPISKEPAANALLQKVGHRTAAVSRAG